MSKSDILNNKLQLLGKLSASLVHEIRNPLFALKLNLDYLSQMRSQVSDDASESIQSCSEATDRLMFLIQNFSDFSKKHSLETELCSINDVTQIAVNIMQSNACRINMYIETELQPNLPSIYFQKDKLLQVFLNLLTNAIEAENTRNTIFVRTYMDDSEDEKILFWEVEDNGIGIKEENKSKIFEDFYTSKKQGTGLGLSVCKKLLSEYNAELDFKSRYGQGSKFFIKFNLNRIIIIDDDELVCRTLQRVLLKFEYEVEYCLDGERAVEKVKDYEPDLILLDIYLTTVNGLDLLKEFQKQFFNTPVIMITGYSDVNIAVKAMKLGAYDFLLKPVDIDQLKLIVEKAFSNINLKAEVDKLNAIVKDDLLTKDFFGKSSKIKKILSAVEKLAKSMDTTILIDGESGTGKEMFAKFIHQNSPRANGPFIQINCSAIPRELAESELFGHEKGAFTGAQQKTKLGKFELANGGTI